MSPSEHYEHGRIHHLLRGRPVTKAEIVQATGWSERDVDRVIGRMVRLGLIRRASHMTWERSPLNSSEESAPDSERRLLPMLEEGSGERHEGCLEHSQCLGRFTKRHPLAHFARCPEECRAYQAIPRELSLLEATVRRQSQGSP